MPLLAAAVSVLLTIEAGAGGRAVTGPSEAASCEAILSAVAALPAPVRSLAPASRAEIVASLSSAEVRARGQRVFAVWYCPYSGEAGCHVLAYRFDGGRSRWLKVEDRVVEGTTDLAATLPAGAAALRLAGTDGKVLLTVPLKPAR